LESLIGTELDPLDPVLELGEASLARELLFPEVGSNVAYTSDVGPSHRYNMKSRSQSPSKTNGSILYRSILSESS